VIQTATSRYTRGAVMTEPSEEFNRGAVQPMECLREAWELIKGESWLFLGMGLVGGMISSVGMGIISGAMICGMDYCLLRRLRGQSVTIGMLFKGFDYFVQGLIATLLMAIPTIVLIVGSYVAMFALMFGLVAIQPRQGPPEPWFIWVLMGGIAVI